MHIPLTRRLWCSASAAALAGLHRAARAAPPLDGAWTDRARGRSVPWRLRLPSQPGPWSLVLYSHGLGGNREGAAAWGQAWADAGVAVLHLQHPGSDTETLRSGMAALRAAASAAQLLARVRDVRHALDEVGRPSAQSPGPFWRLEDSVPLRLTGKLETGAASAHRTPHTAHVLRSADQRRAH